MECTHPSPSSTPPSCITGISRRRSAGGGLIKTANGKARNGEGPPCSSW
ncbi:hypothetical protein HMPREF9057_00925, partial [Actinomyces sp. oral taxon 171 str. F0337]